MGNEFREQSAHSAEHFGMLLMLLIRAPEEDA